MNGVMPDVDAVVPSDVCPQGVILVMEPEGRTRALPCSLLPVGFARNLTASRKSGPYLETTCFVMAKIASTISSFVLLVSLNV